MSKALVQGVKKQHKPVAEPRLSDLIRRASLRSVVRYGTHETTLVLNDRYLLHVHLVTVEVGVVRGRYGQVQAER